MFPLKATLVSNHYSIWSQTLKHCRNLNIWYFWHRADTNQIPICDQIDLSHCGSAKLRKARSQVNTHADASKLLYRLFEDLDAAHHGTSYTANIWIVTRSAHLSFQCTGRWPSVCWKMTEKVPTVLFAIFPTTSQTNAPFSIWTGASTQSFPYYENVRKDARSNSVLHLKTWDYEMLFWPQILWNLPHTFNQTQSEYFKPKIACLLMQIPLQLRFETEKTLDSLVLFSPAPSHWNAPPRRTLGKATRCPS